ncbi:MAG: SLC13 family permease [bacterium]
MWLNVLAFILSSLLVKTKIAKRIALTLIVKFGHSAMLMMAAFRILQLVLAPMIPATAARTVITLPIMLIVASIYGSTNDNPNRFGKNLFLQNLLGINIFSSGFMTGSTANLIAISFIFSMAGTKVYYTDWMIANLPVVLVTMAIAWIIGPKLLFKLRTKEKLPAVKGGIEALKKQLDAMGKMSSLEKKGTVIFGIVVILWVTDRFHVELFGFQIDPVMAAMIGGIITLLPKVGLLKWNECDIPWHLMLFSAGAYAGGLALNDTGAAKWVIQNLFVLLNIGKDINFWVLYTIVIAVMMYSHLVFTSKTMRTIILIPFTIALAQELGINPLALALPAAFTIDWVVGLSISAKPNVILFTTGQYSVLDNLKYGIIIATIGVFLFVLAGLTWFRFLGIAPF